MQTEEKDRLQSVREQDGRNSRFKLQLLGYDRKAVDHLYAEYDAISAKNSRTIQELTEREATLTQKNQMLSQQLEEWQESVKRQYEVLDELTQQPLKGQMDGLRQMVERLTAERNGLSTQLAQTQTALRQSEEQNCLLKERLVKTNAQLTSRNLAIHQAQNDLSLEMDQMQSIYRGMTEELCRMANQLAEKAGEQAQKLAEHQHCGVQALQTLYSEVHPQQPGYPDVLSIGALKIQTSDIA